MLKFLVRVWRTNPRSSLFFFCTFAWLLWISGIFGNSGVLQAYQLSNARYELSMRIKALGSENQRLEHALDSLQKDRFSQEKAIRETIGFVKENEIIFEFR